MKEIMDTMHDEDTYGHLWAEVFVAVILARVLTLFRMFGSIKMVILIPFVLLTVHLLFGKLIKKYSYK